jgi:putative DNA primase/helicase
VAGEDPFNGSGNGRDTESPPPPPPPEPEPQAESASFTDVEITRLAKMSVVDYEHSRKAAAEVLNVRASILDKLVQGERVRLGLDGGDDKQGHTIEFPAPEPWPNPVDGAEVLDEIAKVISAHVIMAEHSRDACALWAAHTFLTDCTMISPRLAFTSPVKGCGKTTALDVMGQLVLRPLAAANVSPSAIFRVVEACHPTLLIDEADSFLKDNEELRGVLNSGHRRGGSVLRTVAVGDDFEVRSFSTYGPCVIALIGQLPGTLADRSVSIALTRRKRDEAITPFRLDRVGHLVTLARKLARWTNDNEEAIAGVEPEMPAGLYNRAADNWRPLLVIATVAGGDWLARGHRAAIASADADVDEAWLELALKDIRAICVSKGLDRISSALLAELMTEIEGRPWAEYGRNEKPITPAKLARLLKPLGIVSQQIRFAPDDTRKGYYLRQFEEAFSRYLGSEDDYSPPEGGPETKQRNNADEMCTSDLFQNETAETDVSFRKCEKSNNDGLCFDVSVGEAGLGGKTMRTARSKSDDLPYDGPVVEVPEQPADPLDEHGAPLAATPTNGGTEPGLSRQRIRELADWYSDQGHQRHCEDRLDTAELDTELRMILREEVAFPEHVEIEFERVMQVVFKV